MLKNSCVAYRLPGRSLALLAFLGALALAPAWVSAQTVCSPTPTALCLQGSRFQAEVTWTAPGFGSGQGRAVPLTGDTGYFWFFSNSNVELMVKVLDGRAVNRHFWVFFGALSDVGYTLTITDLQTGAREVFTNPQGRLASVSDVAAFNPEAPPSASRAASAGAFASAPPEAPLRAGAEIPLNAVTAGNQTFPAVAVAPDGSFMTVWTREPLPGNGQADLFGRIYDAAGNPRTGEIRLNDTPLAGYHPRARVAANAAGGFMAVWSDSSGYGGKLAQARLYSSGGQPLGGVIQLAAGNDAGFPFVSPPDVTADPAGGFLTAWIEYGDLGATTLVTQRFDALGGRLGSPVTFSAQYSIDIPRLATFPGGGFLVAWASVGSGIDFFVSDLWAQRLDASGQPVGASILINPESRQLGGKALIAPVAYADGGFSVIWVSVQLLFPLKNGLSARRFAADGTPLGGITSIRPDFSDSTSAPAAIALPSGDTWILWNHERVATAGESGIYSGVFDPAWTLQGSVTRVNSFSSPSGETDPAVAAAGVNAVAVWSDEPQFIIIDPPPPNLSGGGVFGQRFTLASCELSSNELCLGERFRVGVQFTDPRNGQASSGAPVPLTGDTGAFWFFAPANLELVLKVLDGRAVNGHFWVFYGALSDVAYTVTVTDTVTGTSRTYHNDPHHLASRSDVTAF